MTRILNQPFSTTGTSDPLRGRRRANTLTRTIKSNGVCPGAVVEGGEVLEGRGAKLAEEYGSTPVVLPVMAPNMHRW